MVKIKYIHLYGNKPEYLPKEICNFPSDATVYLHGNPLSFPPLDVCVSGMPSIKSYFQSLEGDTVVKRTKRTKMIIHGVQPHQSKLPIQLFLGGLVQDACVKEKDRTIGIAQNSQSERCSPCPFGLWWSMLLLTHQSTFHQQ